MAIAARQNWSPEQYATNARFVSDLAMPVVELLAPRAGERILDLGCGDGSLTKKLVELGCQVVGVAASPAMVAAAKALGLDAQVMDGQCMPFRLEFDAVFSNAALHWMQQLDAVMAGVWQSLKPGGRFVGECGGSGNTATIVQALERALRRRGINAQAVNPWHFPTVDEYRNKVLGSENPDITNIVVPASARPTMENIKESFPDMNIFYVNTVPEALELLLI